MRSPRRQGLGEFADQPRSGITAGPARTPKEIAATLNREINFIISQTDTKERLAAIGFDPVGTTSEEFAAQLRIEADKWVKVIRAAKLKAQ